MTKDKKIASPRWPALAGTVLAFLLAALSGGRAAAEEPIKIGLVAALSGGSAQSGEGITRGLTIAIDEINASGGLLGGRKLELIRRDTSPTRPKGRSRRAS